MRGDIASEARVEGERTGFSEGYEGQRRELVLPAKQEIVRVVRVGQVLGVSMTLGQRVLRSRRRCSSRGRISLIVSQRWLVPGSARSEPEVSIARDVQVAGRLESSVASSGLGIQKLFIRPSTRKLKECRWSREGRMLPNSSRRSHNCCVLSLASIESLL